MLSGRVAPSSRNRIRRSRGTKSVESRDSSPRSCNARSPVCLICTSPYCIALRYNSLPLTTAARSVTSGNWTFCRPKGIFRLRAPASRTPNGTAGSQRGLHVKLRHLAVLVPVVVLQSRRLEQHIDAVADALTATRTELRPDVADVRRDLHALAERVARIEGALTGPWRPTNGSPAAASKPPPTATE